MIDLSVKPKTLFSIQNVIFKSVHISREGQVSTPLDIQLFSEIKVREQERPDLLQVDLRVTSSEDSPVTLQLEVVGLFRLIEGEEQPDKAAIHQFVFNTGVFSLWPTMSYMVRTVTTHMGMSPLSVNMPVDFQRSFDEED